jgi:hypothetical protein
MNKYAKGGGASSTPISWPTKVALFGGYLGVRSGPVWGPIGLRSGPVWGSLGLRSGLGAAVFAVIMDR